MLVWVVTRKGAWLTGGGQKWTLDRTRAKEFTRREEAEAVAADVVLRKPELIGEVVVRKALSVSFICKQPDRHVATLLCGYPLPCPYHPEEVT